MKTTFIRTLLKMLIATTLLFGMSVGAVHCQENWLNRKRKPRHFGIETGVGIQNFTMKGNLPEYNNLKIAQEGYTVGFFGGGKGAQFKVRKGFFRAYLMDDKIPVNNIQATLNVFPMRYFNTKNEFIRPYIITGVERNSLKVAAWITPPPPPLPAPAVIHNCTPPDPDAGSETVTTPPPPADPVLRKGTYTAIRIIAGSGIQVRIEKKRYFVNLHAEVQFGFPVHTEASVAGFEQTNVTRQFTTNGGIALGKKYSVRRRRF